MDRSVRFKLGVAAVALLALMGACTDAKDTETSAPGASATTGDAQAQQTLSNLGELAQEGTEEAPLESVRGVAARTEDVAATLEEASAGDLPSPAPSVDPSASPAPQAIGGVLGTILAQQVGTFQLIGAQVDDQTIGNGATEALNTAYSDPSTQEVVQHGLMLWGSAEQANSVMSNILQGATGQGYTVDQTLALTGADGAPIGTANALTAPDGTRAIVWTDLDLCLIATGNAAVDFFNNVTY
ncbi:MAG: hypothetical protein QOH90_1137 [Actinomycetota bacterium]|nr:hypothetical protein [Actinomycetota bacterium]